jgi:hypothetical protein
MFRIPIPSWKNDASTCAYRYASTSWMIDIIISEMATMMQLIFQYGNRKSQMEPVLGVSRP